MHGDWLSCPQPTGRGDDDSFKEVAREIAVQETAQEGDGGGMLAPLLAHVYYDERVVLVVCIVECNLYL